MKNTKLCLLSLLVGVFAGIAGGTFRWCLNQTVNIRDFMFAHDRSILFHGSVLLGMFILAMIIYWLTIKVPLISGSGIPQSRGVIFGRFKFNHPWEQFFSKYLGSLGAIGMGMSLGREGPSVMMGTLGGNLAANRFKVTHTEKRYLQSAGAASGLAAAFTAPLASTIFILCDTMEWISWRLVVPGLLACIVSAYCASVIIPVNPYLSVNIVFPNDNIVVIALMLIGLGLLAALGGKLFNLTLFHCKRWYKNIKAKPWMKILVVIIITYIGGMLILDLMSGGETELIKQALTDNGNVWWLFAMVVIKIALTTICYSTGLCGSLLLPLIVMGGLTGKGFALLLIQMGLISPVSAGFFTIIGMATIFVAVVRAPISGMMLVLEMTKQYDLFLPLIIAGTVTYVIGGYLYAVPAYHTLYSLIVSEESNGHNNLIYTHFEVNKYSYWNKKTLSQLDLPRECSITSVNNIAAPLFTAPLKDGDLVKVTIPENNYEYLFKVFRALSNE